MPELALDQRQRDPLVQQLDGVGMPQLVVVPTSAQAIIKPTFSLSRLDEEVDAHRGIRRIVVGITRAPVSVLLDSFPEIDRLHPGTYATVAVLSERRAMSRRPTYGCTPASPTSR